MIKLTGLNKYFFKRKSNEIHVINDISLELPEKGLVVLLGPSGSGKTTLLNVLGGLDKAHNGTIEFDGFEMNKYRSKKWDEIRNKKIGYIFQNYNLLTDITVYDNIKMTLNMAGITDLEEIDKRVNYILESIGMINYRKRKAAALSGGQQQRVAIARALAKNPKVIIADEPTGNLDSKNSIDIMNIIKSISKEKLVILVTHERELADFYADRVIELEDGKIVRDNQNTSLGDLEYRHETDIYLKDLKQISDTKDNNANVKIYSDEEEDTSFDIRIVIKNKTVYLDIKNDDYPKQKLLDSTSEVRLLDKHYEKVTNDNFVGQEFELDKIVDETKVDKQKSVISFKENIKIAFTKFTGVKKSGYILYAGYFAIAFLISIAVGLVSNLVEFTPNSYLEGNHKDTVLIEYDALESYDYYTSLQDESFVDYMVMTNKLVRLNFNVPFIFQSNELNLSLDTRFANIDYIDGKKVVGRLATDFDEIVIDKYQALEMINSSDFADLGIDEYKDLLNLDFDIVLESPYGDTLYNVKIVGVYETESPVIYGFEETLYMMSTGIGVYEVFEEGIAFTDGDVSSTFETMIVYENSIDVRDASDITYVFEDDEAVILTGSGKYTRDSDDIPKMLVKLDVLKEMIFNAENNSDPDDLVVYHLNNYKKAKEFFDDEKIENIVISIDYKDDYGARRLAAGFSTLIFAVVLLVSSFVSYYFVLRSSLLSRIYEISVYRALGASKLDLVKIFLSEILLVTTLTSLPGYILSAYIFYSIQEAGGGIVEYMNYSLISMTLGVLFVYAINIFSGLLPVTNLLRKTPAEILSRYDF